MSAASPEDDKSLGEKLVSVLGTRYEFVSRLGAGAFGEVYRMRDSMLDRDVAIKRVRLDAFTDTTQRDEIRERTIREARVAAKIQHRHIVTIYDIVDLPDMSFILMEFIEGRTLAHLLKEKGRLTLDESIRILKETADALDFAHEKGVVHRDIKPANIMIESAKGQVKVTDFGIAKSDSFTELTAAGSILGTPNYMSPEQARGDAHVDSRSDLFALGCVAYECLSGKKAFRGKNVMATLMTIMNEPPAPIDYSALGLNPDLSLVLKHALAKRPDDRFQKGRDLVEALTSLPPSEPSPTVAITTAPPSTVESPVVTRREPGNTSSFDVRLQGTLSDISVAELVRDVYRSRSTGILHLKREGVGKRIYMQKGSVVFANSDVEEDRLGEFLIRKGKINRGNYDAASEAMRRTGKRMGKTLVELEAVSADEIEELVRAQVNEIIFSVFDWNSGVYGFELLERPVEEDIIVELSTAELILEGVRRIDSLSSVRTALGATERVLRHTEDPLLLYQKMTLTPSEGFVLSRVDGATSVADIAAISPLGEEETLRCVYALVAAGVVDLVAKGAPMTWRIAPSPRSAEEKPSPGAVEDSPAGRNGKKKAGREEPSETDRLILDDIATKHASLETADLYQLLETSPGASDDELKRAYYAMAKKYHPDRHHLPQLREAQGLLEELFAKLTDAYERLSDPAERRRYDGARQDKKRADAAAAPAQGKGSPTPDVDSVPPEVVAERQYQKALLHFDQMQYFDAIQCVRDSVRMVPGDPRFRKLLARALTKNPKWRREAETHFLEALKHDEFDIECLMGLAETYEAANLSTRAAKIYERVLTYDPDNVVARERLHGKSSEKRGRSRGSDEVTSRRSPFRGQRRPPRPSPGPRRGRARGLTILQN